VSSCSVEAGRAGGSKTKRTSLVNQPLLFVLFCSGNLTEWMAWAFFNKHVPHLSDDECQELESLVHYVESKYGIHFGPFYNPKVRCIRLNLDPLSHRYRPLAAYLVCIVCLCLLA
jgi:hypothetical protein